MNVLANKTQSLFALGICISWEKKCYFLLERIYLLLLKGMRGADLNDHYLSLTFYWLSIHLFIKVFILLLAHCSLCCTAKWLHKTTPSPAPCLHIDFCPALRKSSQNVSDWCLLMWHEIIFHLRQDDKFNINIHQHTRTHWCRLFDNQGDNR